MISIGDTYHGYVVWGMAYIQAPKDMEATVIGMYEDTGEWVVASIYVDTGLCAAYGAGSDSPDATLTYAPHDSRSAWEEFARRTRRL